MQKVLETIQVDFEEISKHLIRLRLEKPNLLDLAYVNKLLDKVSNLIYYCKIRDNIFETETEKVKEFEYHYKIIETEFNDILLTDTDNFIAHISKPKPGDNSNLVESIL